MQEKLRKGKCRIGVFCVGYDRYWPQFDGLLEDMLAKHEQFKSKISDSDTEIIDFGMIDNPETAYRKVKDLQGAGLDLIFCNMVTYATSGTFGIIIKTLNIPIILVALQPLKAMDYSRASTYMQLMNDDICAMPEFGAVAVRMGKKEYKHSNVNISRKVLKRPKFKQKTSFNGYERKYKYQ